MKASKHINSITAFFPCYNDGGTIASLVVLADNVLKKITNDYEIIVIDDGSSDHGRRILNELQCRYKKLRLIYHDKNKGYGAALRSGITAASKDLIFYTDGDYQYDVTEVRKLYEALSDEIDIVNGYKINRHDPPHRIIIGKIYQHLIKLIFGLKIKDVDCDFRLMRRSIFDRFTLEYDSGVICVEMIKKIQDAGFCFAEVPVSHYWRSYGKSQFFNFKRLFLVAVNLTGLWWKLVIKKESQKNQTPAKLHDEPNSEQIY